MIIRHDASFLKVVEVGRDSPTSHPQRSWQEKKNHTFIATYRYFIYKLSFLIIFHTGQKSNKVDGDSSFEIHISICFKGIFCFQKQGGGGAQANLTLLAL